jgi:NADH:ubiquinone oxidoreductase subunit 5 (subunit L)/multisubunit Na+/H+ antiporter MnhA subunit
MDALAGLIPLIPFFAVVIIGIGNWLGWIADEKSEAFTAMVANWAITMACLLALVLLGADGLGKNSGAFTAGNWLASDTFKISFSFLTSGFNAQLAAVFSILIMITARFSVNYMHREPGFHRFFGIICLFASAVFLIVLSGNMAGTFLGWELAGLSSYLLIAYAYDRPVASTNATRVFVTNRIGDAGFILGIGLCYAWLESTNWRDLNASVVDLSKGEAAALGLCFTIAALVKSAQLPFTPWLARSMEGPTPSSAVFYGAVMIHSGVYLIILLQPIVDNTPLVQGMLVLFGSATAIYGFFTGLTQTDVKSSMVYATAAQLGLMFIECGLGFWHLASWHLCAHAIVRGYLMLVAPSFMQNVKDNPVKPVLPMLAKSRRLFTASIQRFWIEQINDWALVRPVQKLAHDLSYFDDFILDKLMGVPVPALNAVSTLAQLEENELAADIAFNVKNCVHQTGFIGLIMGWLTDRVHWFEDRLVLQGISRDALHIGRNFGHLAHHFELIILRPRYLVLFVMITLLVAF